MGHDQKNVAEARRSASAAVCELFLAKEKAGKRQKLRKV